MNLLKNNLLLFLFVSVLVFTSCENEENDNAKKETLFGLTSQNDDLSTLKKALEMTGLNTTLEGSSLMTLFAPSNVAFSNFLAENGFNSIDEVPVTTLREILLNHVIDGRIKEQDLPVNTYIKSNATGYASSTNKLSLYFRTTDSEITINGMADLTGQTLLASNGIIHIVKIAMFRRNN